MNKTIHELNSLTQAQADDELIIYDVSEGESKKIQVQALTNPNYSTTEQKTGGTWIDGKPIYRKVVSGITYSSGNVSVSFGLTNVDIVVKLEFYEEGVTTSGYTSYVYNGNRSGWALRFNKTTGIADTVDRSSGIMGDNGIFILEYTKTTD